MTAEEAIDTIDSLLMGQGYDSWRKYEDKDYKRTVDAFQDFLRDFQDTESGKLRDNMNVLQEALEEVAKDAAQLNAALAEIERLRARLVEVHKIIPPPSPVTGYHLIDSAKVRLFDAVQAILYEQTTVTEGD